jgi:hypothetical protein
MNAFEEIVAGLLRQDGCWTIVGYKVNLSKKGKVELGKPSLPRPEIDILSYKAGENLLLWVECKSYLDSRGVSITAFTGEDERGAQRYKVFNLPEYRRIVTEELIKQVVTSQMVLPNPIVKYCLVAGRIATETDRIKLHQYFEKQSWLLYDDSWIKQQLIKASTGSYEDDIATIVAKLFAR